MPTSNPAGVWDSCATPAVNRPLPDLPRLAPACHSSLNSKVTFSVRPILITQAKLYFNTPHLTTSFCLILFQVLVRIWSSVFTSYLLVSFPAPTRICEQWLCPIHCCILSAWNSDQGMLIEWMNPEVISLATIHPDWNHSYRKQKYHVWTHKIKRNKSVLKLMRGVRGWLSH